MRLGGRPARRHCTLPTNGGLGSHDRYRSETFTIRQNCDGSSATSERFRRMSRHKLHADICLRHCHAWLIKTSVRTICTVPHWHSAFRPQCGRLCHGFSHRRDLRALENRKKRPAVPVRRLWRLRGQHRFRRAKLWLGQKYYCWCLPHEHLNNLRVREAG